jgi:serine phosphatase RsbU (regulator of sigma subunit)
VSVNPVKQEDVPSIQDILQKFIIPARLPLLEGVRLATYYSSATSGSEIGGDFYDFIRLPDDRLAFFIGDVSGHGLEATHHSSFVRHVTRAFAREDSQPETVLARANSVCINEFNRNRFVTALYGVYDRDSGRLEYAIAGHPPPLLIAGRAVTPLEATILNPALGIFDQARWETEVLELAPEDIFLCYTDALLEARPCRRTETFGLRRIIEELERTDHSSVNTVVDAAVNGSLTYAEGKLEDDLAIVALQRV